MIRYGDPACPPFRTEGAVTTVTVPDSGRVCTSSPVVTNRQVRDRFEFLDPNGTKRGIRFLFQGEGSQQRAPGEVAVWGGSLGGKGTLPEGISQVAFYVGTWEEYQASQARIPWQ
jgi:hypothetical protein